MAESGFAENDRNHLFQWPDLKRWALVVCQHWRKNLPAPEVPALS